MTDYVSPKDLVHEAVQLAAKKTTLSIKDMLTRGILAGAFLGYATSLVFNDLLPGSASPRRCDSVPGWICDPGAARSGACDG